MSTDSETVPVQIAACSHTGARERNEDACGYSQHPGPVCCVLADGAGGHGGGDVASKLAIDAVLGGFAQAPEVSPQRVRALIEAANVAVIAAQADGSEVSDMRTTLVVLAFDPESGSACWGHIGDSRLYCFREGYVVFKTRDHSLLQSLVDAGLASADDIRGNVQRTVLTASVGSDDGFTPDILETEAKLRSGDAFLLCSDGFWEVVDEREMESALQAADSPETWLAQMERLIEQAQRPGQDNYSAIAVFFGELDFSTRLQL